MSHLLHLEIGSIGRIHTDASCNICLAEFLSPKFPNKEANRKFVIVNCKTFGERAAKVVYWNDLKDKIVYTCDATEEEVKLTELAYRYKRAIKVIVSNIDGKEDCYECSPLAWVTWKVIGFNTPNEKWQKTEKIKIRPSICNESDDAYEKVSPMTFIEIYIMKTYMGYTDFLSLSQ